MSLNQTDIIQNVRIWIHENKLAFNWDLQQTGKQLQALSIEVSTSADFIGPDFRHFVLPPVKGCMLDVGGAPTGSQGWNIRLAAWTGTDKRGTLEYTGVYGPIPFYTAQSGGKPPPEIAKPQYKINHTQAIDKGIKFFLGEIKKQYALIEYSKEETLKGATKRCLYIQDWIPNGEFECSPIDPSYTYTMRFTLIGPSMPTNTIITLDKGITFNNKKPKAPMQHLGVEDRTMNIGMRTLLQESKEKPLKFSSQKDYAMYLAAKEKFSSKPS